MTNLVVGLITSLSIFNNAMDDVTRSTFKNRFIIRVKLQRNGFDFISLLKTWSFGPGQR
jgi:hypothetical protein